MLLRAGLFSLALLIASRLLGLVRESAQAAAFGATGLADVAVLMLSLPDWITGVLAAGALSYVLVPAWAGQGAHPVAASQRRVARALLALGLALALAAGAALVLAPAAVLGALVPGLPAPLAGAAAWGLAWSALALPLALLAALWATRLQHEGDAVGLYGANLVVNGALVAAIAVAGWVTGTAPGMAGTNGSAALLTLGLGLLAAMGLRLGWQAWRERRTGGRAALADSPASGQVSHASRDFDAATLPEAASRAASRAAAEAPRPLLLSLPGPPVWAWAILSAGLPLALPFAARSLASAQGEGALAVFNYAWKLVELPLMLAIQLVATLAFPRVAQAVAAGLERPEARASLQAAFGLAFALACAAAAGLFVAAEAVAQLLFGWGRMDAAALAQVAGWGRIGAWSLLPQAVSAVGLTVLAAQGRLRPAAAWHALALVGVLAAGRWLAPSGAVLMAVLDAVLLGVALGVLAAMGRAVRRLLPWASMGAALGVLLAVAALVAWASPASVGTGLAPPTWASLSLPLPMPWQLALGALAALCVLAAAWVAGGTLRRNLRGT